MKIYSTRGRHELMQLRDHELSSIKIKVDKYSKDPYPGINSGYDYTKFWSKNLNEIKERILSELGAIEYDCEYFDHNQEEFYVLTFETKEE